MANNEFGKEEKVIFDKLLEGYQDALVLSRNIAIFNTDPVTMERTNDTIWRPMPYIAQSFDGPDATGNFYGNTQLSVPSTIGYHRHVPNEMTVPELRDAIQENRLGQSAIQKLSSDINKAVMDVAAKQGTLFVKRTAAATGYDDVAQCEAIMNEQGIMSFDRYLALSTRDYNGMADGLAKSYMAQKAARAYEKGFVGEIASFETYKLDYATSLTAAAGGGSLTVDTRATASNYYVPVATRTATTGERSNVDNRYQTITISSTTSVAAGDAFTIAGVYAVHHITKGSTGQLKTFRVISVDSSTTMTISPAIVSNQGGSAAEAQYQNCEVTASATAAIVFLNTVTKSVNPFWHRDAIEIIPGTYPVPSNGGVAVMRGSTDQGLELCMQKWVDGNTGKVKLRWDTRFGVVMLQPEMAGIMMFSQS